jgi:hypothetical protein
MKEMIKTMIQNHYLAPSPTEVLSQMTEQGAQTRRRIASEAGADGGHA